MATRLSLANYPLVQDTITKNRVTLQLGLRYDYNKDTAEASSIVANPLGGPWLPGITFPGADPGVAFKDFSPRLGITYNLTGDGRTLARANYARYYGQVGNGGLASTINPWVDTPVSVDSAPTGPGCGNGEMLAPRAQCETNWSAANLRTRVGEPVDPTENEPQTRS